MDGPCEFDGMLAILRHDPAQVVVDEVKQLATLQARAALAGWELARMPGGDFVIGRWGMVKALPDAAAVEAFLVQVGAPGA